MTQGTNGREGKAEAEIEGAVVEDYPGFFSLPRLGVMARHFFRSRANSAQVLIGSPR